MIAVATSDDAVDEGDPEIAGWYYQKGRIFQLMLVMGFALRALTRGQYDVPVVVRLIDLAGMGIFMYCLAILYAKKPKNLLTSGVFRYTRHPMYTGAFMMAIYLWWPIGTELNVVYWALLAEFLIGLFVAGYMQECETLARFGVEAEWYYRRTPRLFLFYPFRQRS